MGAAVPEDHHVGFVGGAATVGAADDEDPAATEPFRAGW